MASLMSAVAKHVFLVTEPARLEATVRTAFEIARTGRPGPVVIDLPKDVQNAVEVFRGEGRLPIPGYRARLAELTASTLGEAAAGNFLQLLAESKRPLIYAGGGVINGAAAPALAELVACARHSGRDHADGHRGDRHHRSAGDAHARHARGRLCQLRGRGLRFPDRRGGAVRRSGRGRSAQVRAPRAPHRAPGHRSGRDQQGQERALEPRRAAARGAARADRVRAPQRLHAPISAAGAPS